MVANSDKATRRDRIDRPSAFNLCMNAPVRWIRVPVWPSEPTSWGKVSHIGARSERSSLGALSSRRHVASLSRLDYLPYREDKDVYVPINHSVARKMRENFLLPANPPLPIGKTAVLTPCSPNAIDTFRMTPTHSKDMVPATFRRSCALLSSRSVLR
ncbi:hypothetical protein CIHG_02104 [Coccidioides immitis H538.4]|uniref:Uncharacterized protein n=2 Tax=Coccidioides immitis TaxID=5501 RepID=A0A0J8UB47_COCIT|nr:hypothetical protein CIRG_00280 [Coccidioides immitis RMSCC 2394]KMU84318.1 hypothetical protein CIHG_02104 [Coccidioides immitis H538.4]